LSRQPYDGALARGDRNGLSDALRGAAGVTSGSSDGRSTLVLAGTSARADRGADAIPFATGTSADMRAAAEAGDVERILALADRRDAITLWHLSWRDARARGRLRDVLPPPLDVDVATVDGMFDWLRKIEADSRSRNDSDP
jgi:hypothetical protein